MNIFDPVAKSNNKFDTGPLSWVMPETRESFMLSKRTLMEALQQTGEAQLSLIYKVKFHIHQAHGALELVNLNGVGLLISNIEVILDQFIDGKLTFSLLNIKPIELAVDAIQHYLDEILRISIQKPLLLFPYYRQLHALLGHSQVSEKDLFFPTLFAKDKLVLIDIDSKSEDEIALKLSIHNKNGEIDYDLTRRLFERALLQLLTASQSEEIQKSTQQMQVLIVAICSAQHRNQDYVFWMVLAAFSELVNALYLPVDQSIKQLFAKINLQIQFLQQGRHQISESLLRDALFFISQAKKLTPNAKAISQAYQLDGQISFNQITSSPARVEPGAHSIAKERLSQVKYLWSRIATGEDSSFPKFEQKMLELADVVQKLKVPPLTKLLRELSELSRHVLQGPPSDAFALEMATSLLFVETTLDELGHLPTDFAERADMLGARLLAVLSGEHVSSSVPWLDAISTEAQQRQTMLVLVAEMQASLRIVEKTLDDYFRNPVSVDDLIQIDPIENQIIGVLGMLDQEDGKQALIYTQQLIRDLAISEQPTDIKLHRKIALNIAALSFLIDALQLHPEAVKSQFTFDAQEGFLRSHFLNVFEQDNRLLPQESASEEHERLAALISTKQAISEEKCDVNLIHNLEGNDKVEVADSNEDEPLIDFELTQQNPQPLPTVSPSLSKSDDEPVQISSIQHIQFKIIDENDIQTADIDNAINSAIKDLSAQKIQENQNQVSETLKQSFDENLTNAALLEKATDAISSYSNNLTASPVLAPIVKPIIPQNDELLDAELLEIFLLEAIDVLQTVEHHINLSRDDVSNHDYLITLRRAFHTLKGSSRMVGLDAFGQAAWSVEQVMNLWLSELRDGNDFLYDLLNKAHKVLSVWVEELQQKGNSTIDGTELILAAKNVEIGKAIQPKENEANPNNNDSLFGVDFANNEIAHSSDITENDVLAAYAALNVMVEEPSGSIQSSAHSSSSVVDHNFNDAKATEFNVDLVDENKIDQNSATQEDADLSPSKSQNEREDIADPTQKFAIELEALLSEIRFEQPVSLTLTTAHKLPSTTVEERDGQAAAKADDLPLEMSGYQDHFKEINDAFLSMDTHSLEQTVQPSIDNLNDIKLSENTAITPNEKTDNVVVKNAEGHDSNHESKLATIGISVDPLSDKTPPVRQIIEFPTQFTTYSDDIKKIGELEIGLPLFTIYLAETDELVRVLTQDFSEWRHEPNRHVSPAAIQAAHTLAGTSATVGFVALREIAYALEMLLQRIGHYPVTLLAGEIDTLEACVSCIRQMLQQFALGEMPPHKPEQVLVLEQLLALIIDRSEQPNTVLSNQQPEFTNEHHSPLVASTIATKAAVVVNSEQVLAHESSQLVDQLDPDLLALFVEEGQELLASIGQSLRALQANPQNQEETRSLLRQLHTLKGSARMAGAMVLGQHTHDMETQLEHFLSAGKLSSVDLESLHLQYDASQVLFERLQHPELDIALPVQINQEKNQLDSNTEVAQLTQESAEINPVADLINEPFLELNDQENLDEFVEPFNQEQAVALPLSLPNIDQALTKSSAPTSTTSTTSTYKPVMQPAVSSGLVRVRADILDRLVNQAGEVSISRSRLENEVTTLRSALQELTENVGRLKGQLREVEIQAETQITSRMAYSGEREFDPLEFDRFTRLQELTRMMAESVNDVASVQSNIHKTVEGAVDDLAFQARLTRELQQDLMRVRMVPFASISERLYRIARQSSKELDKLVQIDIRGTSVEIDRNVLERMAAPFEHLLRNAIVHGIESVEERRALGKNDAGQILIEITQEGNEVIIHFNDDGRGLDLDGIRQKAVQKGLIANNQTLNDDETANLIFEYGVTTATKVTELAGRGVGMDVIRSEATALGGRVTVESHVGKGSQFTIKLPLTLAMTQVVLLRVGAKTFALPSVLVEQVLQLKSQALTSAYNDGAIMWQGQRVALHYFSTVVGELNVLPDVQQYTPVIIMRDSHERIALHVDEIIGNREVVVKNIGPQLSRMRGIAGATVLGTGEIILILNPILLVHKIEQQQLRAPRLFTAEQVQSLPHVDTPFDADNISRSDQILGAISEINGVKTQPIQGLRRLPIVMVVDDSLTVRKVSQRLLQREGFQVVLAKDGVDALEQLQSIKPDVMLVDIEMPRMDGFDLTRNVRNDQRLKNVPIIMITSRTADKHRTYATQLGVNAYFGKPFMEQQLLASIRGFLSEEVLDNKNL